MHFNYQGIRVSRCRPYENIYLMTAKHLKAKSIVM